MSASGLGLVVLLTSLPVLWLSSLFLRWSVTTSPLDNVPGPDRPESWLKGDMNAMADRVHGWEFNKHITETYNGVAALSGPVGSKVLYVFDPKALQRIFRKQATYITSDWITATARLMFGDALISTEGERHRQQRKMLNPAFTAETIHDVVPVLHRVAESLRSAIHAKVREGPKPIDVAHWAGRVVNELMAQGLMGHPLDPLVRPPDVSANLSEAGKGLVPAVWRLHAWIMLAHPVEKLIPARVRRVLARWIPHSDFQDLRKMVYDLHDGYKEIFYTRKAALQADASDISPQEQKDLMSILLRETMNNGQENHIPDEELIAHMGLFLFAATDTTKNLLSRAFQLLAENQDVQAKLRSELLAAQEAHGRELPCHVLTKLPYLDAVMKESLRIHPSLPVMYRVCEEDDRLPLSQPIQGRDGATLNEVIVPKGTMLLISIWSYNQSKLLWGEDAAEWKPERWLLPLPDAVMDDQIPGAYSHLMTFGAGKHTCIGMRFAMTAFKVVVARLMADFKFGLTDEKILWNYAGTSFPTMNEYSGEACLRLTAESVVAES